MGRFLVIGFGAAAGHHQSEERSRCMSLWVASGWRLSVKTSDQPNDGYRKHG